MNKKASSFFFFFLSFKIGFECRHQVSYFFDFDLCVCWFLVQLGGSILVEWESECFDCSRVSTNWKPNLEAIFNQ